MERRSAPGTSPARDDSAKLARLRAEFGITETEAGNVLDGCSGSLDQAFALLYAGGGVTAGYVAQETAGRGDAQGPRTAGDGATASGEADQSAGTVNNPIDLTGEEDALQKALALSIQEMQRQSGGGGISIEEQELSRALEASLADNQANMARLGMPMVFVDPLNPFERKRKGLTPVGLKNIGNTCWFSAVIQSLFHVPMFRDVVLTYSPPSLPNGMSEYPQCVRFILELQKLFALLLRSERKYINPQPAIQSLQEAFTKNPVPSAGAQQDVSEFTHKLLEWIEDAFTFSLGNKRANPMLELFNGQYLTEGVIGEKPFVNESEFGAFPMQVQSHTHLHDSLEAATSNPEMQQEAWFSHLPPVLVLELSRFKYNQKSGQAEKIHDAFTFDRQLFMDRYLVANKLESRQRRREVGKLRKKLADLEKRLNSYTHYDRKPISVVETLGLTLKFVHEQESNEEREKEREVGGEGGEKRPRHSLYPLPRFVSLQERETLDVCLGRWREELEQDMAELWESISAVRASLEAVYSDKLMNSTCYHLHAVLVHQGQASGGHYWAYVRKNPVGYHEECEQVEIRVERNNAADSVQSGRHGSESCDLSHDARKSSQRGPLLAECQVTELVVTDIIPQTGQADLDSTSLESGSRGGDSQSEGSETDDSPPPSVLVATEASECGAPSQSDGSSVGRGEGMEVVGGEKSEEEVWLKFNDISVSEVTWEEVAKESYGGRQNTSAYCLIYISDALWQQCRNNVAPPPLNVVLQQLVGADNTLFKTEMVEYSTRQKAISITKQVESERETTTPQTRLEGGAGVLAPASSEETLVEGEASPLAAQHTGSHPVRSPERMQVDPSPSSPPPLPVHPLLISELAIRLEHKHQLIASLATDTLVDPRAVTLASYALHSGVPESLLRACLLPEVEREAGRTDLVLLAKKQLVALLHQQGMQTNLENLRMLYKWYCSACYHCVQAARYISQEKWEMALTYAVHGSTVNTAIVQSSSKQLAVDPEVVGEIRRRAVQGTSNAALALFESGEASKALDVAGTLLVAGLRELTEKPSAGDKEAVEAVREEWCQCLVHPGLNEGDQDRLADLLTRMFDDFSKAPSLSPPDTPSSVNYHALSVELSRVLKKYRQKEP